jgi:hypothetical protein
MSLLRKQTRLLGSRASANEGTIGRGVSSARMRDGVSWESENLASKRRRVIAESLTPVEQSFYRKETDLAQPVNLRGGGGDVRRDRRQNSGMTDVRSLVKSSSSNSTVRQISSMLSHSSATKAIAKKRRRRGAMSGPQIGTGILKRPSPSVVRARSPDSHDFAVEDHDSAESWESMMDNEDRYYREFSEGIRIEESMCMVSSMDSARRMEIMEFEKRDAGREEELPIRVEDAFLMETDNDDRLDGDAIVDLWFESLGKIENRLTLSQQQKDFINSCFISLLPLVYGDQFDVNIVRLTKRFNIDAIYKKIFFEMPRRFGKTTSTSIVSAITAYILPGLSVGIYSIVKSASDSLVECMVDYYETISGMDQKDFVIEWNKTKGRVILRNAHGSTSSVWGYSAVSTVRFFFFPLPLFFLSPFFCVCVFSPFSILLLLLAIKEKGGGDSSRAIN